MTPVIMRPFALASGVSPSGVDGIAVDTWMANELMDQIKRLRAVFPEFVRAIGDHRQRYCSKFALIRAPGCGVNLAQVVHNYLAIGRASLYSFLHPIPLRVEFFSYRVQSIHAGRFSFYLNDDASVARELAPFPGGVFEQAKHDGDNWVQISMNMQHSKTGLRE